MVAVLWHRLPVLLGNLVRSRAKFCCPTPPRFTYRDRLCPQRIRPAGSVSNPVSNKTRSTQDYQPAPQNSTKLRKSTKKAPLLVVKRAAGPEQRRGRIITSIEATTPGETTFELLIDKYSTDSPFVEKSGAREPGKTLQRKCRCHLRGLARGVGWDRLSRHSGLELNPKYARDKWSQPTNKANPKTKLC
jgi:hypothetical protein